MVFLHAKKIPVLYFVENKFILMLHGLNISNIVDMCQESNAKQYYIQQYLDGFFSCPPPILPKSQDIGQKTRAVFYRLERHIMVLVQF